MDAKLLQQAVSLCRVSGPQGSRSGTQSLTRAAARPRRLSKPLYRARQMQAPRLDQEVKSNKCSHHSERHVHLQRCDHRSYELGPVTLTFQLHNLGGAAELVADEVAGMIRGARVTSVRLWTRHAGLRTRHAAKTPIGVNGIATLDSGEEVPFTGTLTCTR